MNASLGGVRVLQSEVHVYMYKDRINICVYIIIYIYTHIYLYTKLSLGIAGCFCVGRPQGFCCSTGRRFLVFRRVCKAYNKQLGSRFDRVFGLIGFGVGLFVWVLGFRVWG